MAWSFVKYMSNAHLNNVNVALYADDGDRAQLRAQRVPSATVFAYLKFPSTEAAERWYDKLPGSGVGRVQNALDAMVDEFGD